MTEDELQIGDIIFFQNNYKTAPPYSYIDHVAIYAGKNSNGYPTIIHSISSNSGHYHPEKSSGLCITTLRALKNQIQQEKGFEDVAYDVSFLAFRNRLNSETTKIAISLLMNQVRYRIPYDEDRLNKKLVLEAEGLDAHDFKRLGEENYRKAGIYRAMKYAARIRLPWVRTRLDGVGRGLTCSMTVILAFQIAELFQKKLIKPIDCDPLGGDEWVSDKYSPEKEDDNFPEAYQDYLAEIRKDRSRTELTSIPSYRCWTGEDCNGELVTPEMFTHDFFPIDAKSIGAAGLFLHMQEQNRTWTELGEIDVLARNFSPEQKEEERSVRRRSFHKSLDALHEIFRLNQSAISPSPSPSAFSISSTSSAPAEETKSQTRNIPWFSKLSLFKPLVKTPAKAAETTNDSITGSSPS
ncbi:hypothetical protein [Legionella yabuuchiae]|uniref:hypothetical protein n=1 Tax=Legionella yabuuchiae TaxID=376727 RepID=UPI001055C06F|nr:hypothetical protein [Legionella yabuuchiae]